MNKLKLSAFIDEYSDDLNEQIDALKRLGISYVELRHCNGKNVSDFDECDVAMIKSAFDNAGIHVSSIGSPIGKISIDGNIEEHLRVAERVFAMANTFGAKYVRVFSFYIPDGKNAEEYRDRVLCYMQRLVELADRYGVTLCHENEAKIYGESPENCLNLLESLDGRLKCVFDMGNFVLDGYEPFPLAFSMLKKHIAYFHIKDALYEGAIVPAGKGEASIKEILSAFTENLNTDTLVTLEPHLETFAGLNALVGKSFENPYKYNDQKEAFEDDLNKFRELMRS